MVTTVSGRLKDILVKRKVGLTRHSEKDKTPFRSCLIFPSLHHWNDHYCVLSSSSIGIQPFDTARPVVTMPTDCVPLEWHAIKCDGGIGNDLKSWFGSHHSLSWQLTDENLNYFLSSPPLKGIVFFGWEGHSNPKSNVKVALTKHLFSLSKKKGGDSCVTFLLRYFHCVFLSGSFYHTTKTLMSLCHLYIHHIWNQWYLFSNFLHFLNILCNNKAV